MSICFFKKGGFLMSYPQVLIDLHKIRHNANHIVNLCKQNKIEVMAITKGVCALEQVVRAMLGGGVKKLGDARIDNIKYMRNKGIFAPIYLIRIPMLSEIKDLVFWADGSLNSEIETIKAISEEAQAKGKIHKVIVMVDVGDLREGFLPEDVVEAVGQIINLPGVEFEGLGTNVGCYGGVLPSCDNTNILVRLAKEIAKKYKVKVKTISGGSTVTLDLLEKGNLAPGVNQFRIGEAILLGTDTVNHKQVPGTFQNTIVLKTEVVELKTKPSKPIGRIGRDAFGNIPHFEDKGLMKRAIVALGRQDCMIEGLKPMDATIQIIGASSDHLILDVSKSNGIGIGSVVDFNMSYGAMLGTMTSKYIDKTFK